MFSRAHYQAIANIIKNATTHDGTIDAKLLVASFTVYFAGDNPKFDGQKFWDACQRDLYDHFT